MVRLPTGTVTFLFTDIEGSTRLVQHLGDARSEQIFADHRRLLRDAVEAAGGSVAEDQGESFLFVFKRARDAVLAAVTAQRALAAHPWPEGGAIRVRVGLHTGEPVSAGETYVGVDVHRVVRICQAGHGGQVLLSQTTRDLVEQDLPGGVSLRDLGEHQLKDLAKPQRLFQVVIPNLPNDFPPLRSLDVLPNNLPRQLTSFIGREKEIVEIRRLLGQAPLLTLTGVGGVGKTRLALQVAAEILQDFKDGVWVVQFASLPDLELVPQTVASVLKVHEQPGQEFLTTLSNDLRPKHLLLVLDNCEHLVTGCAQLADTLLRTCPGLRILATSREPLSIAGETTWRVPSLSLPDPQRPPSLERLRVYEAVSLFAERAVAVAPTFVITDQNAPAVMALCHQLDGIPLAIELAAARVRVLPVEQVADRLADRFRFLTGGSRTALPRHQTLRAAMDWSHDLLPEKERILLRRLSVFAGGFTLEAAEAVCSGQEVDVTEVVDLLTHLVDKSLVVAAEHAGEGRYRLLETIRQYAQGKLLGSGEETEVRRRHCNWCLGLAERMELKRVAPDQAVGLERLETEYDNLRAALEWSLTGMEAKSALRLVAALGWFWNIRGYWTEGRESLKAALSASGSSDPYPRARALFWAGRLAALQHDKVAAHLFREESLAILRQLGSKQELAALLDDLGIAMHWEGDYAAAGALYQESLSIYRELSMKEGIGWILLHLGRLARDQGDLTAARSLCEEALGLCRELSYERGIAYSLSTLASIEQREGDYTAARSLQKEALGIFRELGDKSGIASAISRLATLARDQGDYAAARLLYEECLTIFRELGSRSGIAWTLREIGDLARLQRDWAAARPLHEESLAIFRALGDKEGIGHVLSGLGEVERLQNHYAAASPLHEESLAILRELGDKEGIGYALAGLGEVERLQNRYDSAVALLAEALSLLKEIGDRPRVVTCLERFAHLAAAKGRLNRAARLFAVAGAARDTMGTPLPPSDRADYDRTITAARTGLGDEAFAEAWAVGRAMTLEQAVAYALSEEM